MAAQALELSHVGKENIGHPDFKRLHSEEGAAVKRPKTNSGIKKSISWGNRSDFAGTLPHQRKYCKIASLDHTLAKCLQCPVICEPKRKQRTVYICTCQKVKKVIICQVNWKNQNQEIIYYKIIKVSTDKGF